MFRGIILLTIAILLTNCDENWFDDLTDDTTSTSSVPSHTVVFKGVGKDDDGYFTQTVTFFTDATFAGTDTYAGEEDRVSYAGTYTGNPAIDGSITVKYTKMRSESGELLDFTYENFGKAYDSTMATGMPISISGGKMIFGRKTVLYRQ